MTHRWMLAGALVLLGAGLAPVAAQPPAAARGCPQGRISSVFVDNHSVFDTADEELDRRLLTAYRLANKLHRPTREPVIRRELLFTEGDCYDPEVLRESERVLRAAPFIADADVYGIRQPDGSFHVIVDTQDEWSTRLEPQFDAGSETELTGLELREDNLLGSGRQASVFLLRRYGERTYGATFATPQLFGSRWDASLAVGRTPVGGLVAQSVSYPFVGEFGRWAFLQRAAHNTRFFEFVAPSDTGLVAVLLPEQRRVADVGVLWRTGRRGRLLLLGAGVAGEWIEYPGPARFKRDTPGQRLVADSAFPFALDTVDNVRGLLMAGQRNVYFVRRRALETVNGTEDVRLGVELEAVFGHTIAGLSSGTGLSVELGLGAAGELPGGLLLGSRARMEARRNSDAAPGRTEWSDVFAELSGWAYWRPSESSRHTWVATVDGVGGWHTRVPFQLTLGGSSGLRGYSRHLYPGGRRAVLSLEQRSYLGWPAPDLFDLGGVVALDFGRIWAGDAPYGRNSPYLASGGFGLRFAFPPGSQRSFRLDVAWPLRAGAGPGDFALVAGIGQAIGFGTLRNDPQLERSSRRALSPSLFSFPY